MNTYQIHLCISILVCLISSCKTGDTPQKEDEGQSTTKNVSTSVSNEPGKTIEGDTLRYGSDFIRSWNDDAEIHEQYIVVDFSFEELTKLPEFPKNVFEAQEVWLTGNQIEDVSSLNGFVKLKTLELSQNRINSLTFLKESADLKFLNLDYNQFSEFPVELCGLNKISNLNLRFNDLVVIPECICELESLERLFLDGNQIVDVPSCLFQMPNLKVLFIPDNKVQNIDFKEISKSLEIINLIGNPVMSKMESKIDSLNGLWSYDLFMK